MIISHPLSHCFLSLLCIFLVDFDKIIRGIACPSPIGPGNGRTTARALRLQMQSPLPCDGSIGSVKYEMVALGFEPKAYPYRLSRHNRSGYSVSNSLAKMWYIV